MTVMRQINKALLDFFKNYLQIKDTILYQGEESIKMPLTR